MNDGKTTATETTATEKNKDEKMDEEGELDEDTAKELAEMEKAMKKAGAARSDRKLVGALTIKLCLSQRSKIFVPQGHPGKYYRQENVEQIKTFVDTTLNDMDKRCHVIQYIHLFGVIIAFAANKLTMDKLRLINYSNKTLRTFDTLLLTVVDYSEAFFEGTMAIITEDSTKEPKEKLSNEKLSAWNSAIDGDKWDLISKTTELMDQRYCMITRDHEQISNLAELTRQGPCKWWHETIEYRVHAALRRWDRFVLPIQQRYTIY